MRTPRQADRLAARTLRGPTGQPHAAWCSCRRPASLALELLLVLPVLLILVLALVELGMILGARERLTAACRDGARVAALGGNEWDVEDAVRRHLGDSALNEARIEMDLRNERGRLLPSGSPVHVGVKAPAVLAAPDLLAMIGFSISDEVIEVHAVMRKE